MGFPGGASGIKNRSANAGDIRDVGQKDPLEEGMITHSSILAQRIPSTEEPGRLQSIESKESDTTEVTEHARVQPLSE